MCPIPSLLYSMQVHTYVTEMIEMLVNRFHHVIEEKCIALSGHLYLEGLIDNCTKFLISFYEFYYLERNFERFQFVLLIHNLL